MVEVELILVDTTIWIGGPWNEHKINKKFNKLLKE